VAPAKAMVILIRWTVVIVCSYLIIYRIESTIPGDLLIVLCYKNGFSPLTDKTLRHLNSL